MTPHLCPDCLAELADPAAEACQACGFVRPASGWLADPLTGLILGGRYRLEGRLGAGGMASVFRAARVGALGGKVAVKILAPRLSRTVIARRFEREAQVVSRLSNPHVVRVYDFDTFTLPGAAQPLYYLAMELVEGTNLAQLLRRQGRVDFLWAIDVLRQTARGLDEAHQAGIIHRDLKPSNLMLRQQREATHVKIVDFGIAAATELDGEPMDKLTQTGFVSGTPDYMAPEQAVSTVGLGPEADIYALGVIAFELFSGRRPFIGDSVIDVLMQRVTRPAPSLREACADGALPAEIFGIVDKMLAREPRDRYPNAGALLEDLARFPTLHTRPDLAATIELGRSASSPPDDDPVTSEASTTRSALHQAPLAPPARRRWPWLLATGVVVAGGGVAAWWLVSQPAPPSPPPAPRAEVTAPPTAPPVRPVDPGIAPTADVAEAPDTAVGEGDAGRGDAVVSAPPALPVRLGHPRPPLEPGFTEARVAVGGLTLGVAVPDPRPPLYEGLPLRLGLDDAEGPLRLRDARVVAHLLPAGTVAARAAGSGRPRDGRVPLAIGALPMAGRYRLMVTVTLPDGATHTLSVLYDANTGAVSAAPP